MPDTGATACVICEAGQFMDVKSDGEPFKGVAKERDGRRSDEE